MKKLLRFSFVCLLLMCCGTIFADDVTFDFSTPDGLKAMGIAESNIPTVEASVEAGVPYETTGPFTMNGVTITATDGGTNTSRIWSPKGNDGTKYDFRVYGSKDNPGTITFTAPTGKEITKIEITAGSTWNEPTASVGSLAGKNWSGAANTVTFTQEKQCQYKKVTITYTDAGTVVTKKDAGLSFSSETADAVVGEPFTAPTLTKATTADVKYTSTNTKVATVDESTGAVEIVGAGTATIRATTEENDEYYAGQAEYKITATEPVASEVTLPYEDLTTGQGSFTIDNVSLDEGLTYVWKWDNNNKYMKASAYAGGNKASESHLISPLINLGTATSPKLYFSQCINKYFADYANDVYLFIVKENEDFDRLTLTAPTIEEGKNWSSFKDEEFDLSAYAGQKIKVEFVYTSTSTAAGTWEIKNFKVAEGASGITPATTEINANAPMYNLKGERVDQNYRGVVIQNGVKRIQK